MHSLNVIRRINADAVRLARSSSPQTATPATQRAAAPATQRAAAPATQRAAAPATQPATPPPSQDELVASLADLLPWASQYAETCRTSLHGSGEFVRIARARDLIQRVRA